MSTVWNRFVRFISTDDRELCGEPDSSVTDVGLALSKNEVVPVKVLDVASPLQDGGKFTSETATIKKLLSPLAAKEVGTIRCIGMNYRDHVAEMKGTIPTVPEVFTKPSTTLIGPSDPIILPKIAPDAVDLEVELAVVIGKDCKNVDAESAMDYVLGYTVANDLTCRDVQNGILQWGYCKGYDSFCPIGPVLVSSKTIVDPAKLQLGSIVRGKTLQSSSTSELIFKVPEIISYVSRGTTLPKGTLILTGTPAGIGHSHNPPLRVDSRQSLPPSNVGRLWNTRGAPTYHGNSYFGYQSAADMIEVESPQLPTGMNNIGVRSTYDGRRTYSYRSERGSYSHIWELLGYLPREKAVVDKLVTAFIEHLNQVYDGLHEETFMTRYEAFWNRKWSDDDRSVIDLRWLSLLFIVLAFGELLECPANASRDIRELSEEASLQFYWASRTAITLAMTFYGESTDAVRCGILITRYLVYLGRKTEAWLASSFSIRFAQAQGMHIDGESWGLPPKVLETRRRLWCSAHALDKYISLGLGRPSATSDKNSMEMKIRNVWIDDKAHDEAQVAMERPENDPTPSVFYIHQQKLSKILGLIQEECFLLTPLTTSYTSYAKVLNLDEILLAWAASLPEYFQVENPLTTMDNSRPYLYWQRLYLHFAFHFARVTLHKTYVLLDSIADRFEYSRDVCINSASADLKLKLSISNTTMADRLRAGATMHSLLSSGLVLGVLVVRDPLSARAALILEDLTAYCEKQNSDPWANEFALAEVRVIELCISSARRSRQESGIMEERTTSTHSQDVNFVEANPPHQNGLPGLYRSPIMTTNPAAPGPVTNTENDPVDNDTWLENWFGPTRSLPEPGDFQSWERLIGSLAPLQ
ncbi:hypothetical protein TCE0_038f12598 [Talaromyces pinophilus]|uniref:Xylanolytic transcriptional activator regulatory domain-containing protein n=1 Tax=Talaromyces pinophilus TaxID=128442 RepID=A0A0B8MYJ1_TALPI|nr:hypothetical protein TCE0_038f12598 [Talaromyces pinophilus]